MSSQCRIRLFDRRYGDEPDRIEIRDVLVPPFFQGDRRGVGLCISGTLVDVPVRVGFNARSFPSCLLTLFVQELNGGLVA